MRRKRAQPPINLLPLRRLPRRVGAASPRTTLARPSSRDRAADASMTSLQQDPAGLLAAERALMPRRGVLPFSPPLIGEEEDSEGVVAVRSGVVNTGPRAK